MLIAGLVVAGFLGGKAVGQIAYIMNSLDNTVSVIDIATHSVTSIIPVGNFPFGVSVSPDGTMVYITTYKIIK